MFVEIRIAYDLPFSVCYSENSEVDFLPKLPFLFQWSLIFDDEIGDSIKADIKPSACRKLLALTEKELVVPCWARKYWK